DLRRIRLEVEVAHVSVEAERVLTPSFVEPRAVRIDARHEMPFDVELAQARGFVTQERDQARHREPTDGLHAVREGDQQRLHRPASEAHMMDRLTLNTGS